MPGRIEANRIFGFDAWSRETTDSRCRALISSVD
jgi:recombination DNA repair RAD52 pathway protein